MTQFQERDGIRAAFASDIIRGSGIEIGGGAFPQPLPAETKVSYYDLRPGTEAAHLFNGAVVSARPMTAISEDFPEGTDFLIAHNVLEHAPDPIGTLVNWNAHVRLGGTVLLSLPHASYCDDTRRQIPDVAHLVGDYLEAANGRDFSSREHASSFILGWWQDFAAAAHVSEIGPFSRRALDSMRTADHDLHWHALDTGLCLRIVAAAAEIGGSEIDILKVARPEAGDTVGDILIAYRIVRRRPIGVATQRLVAAAAEMRAALEALTESIGTTLPKPSAARRPTPLSRPFRIEGLCAVSPLPPEMRATNARLVVEEDGNPLGPIECNHEEIRRNGGGRFCVWGDSVYFSASDSSNCNSNGRKYRVVSATEQDAGA